MTLTSILNSTFILPENSFERLSAVVREVSFPKNHILFKAGKKESHLYFIKQGMVRAYAPTEEHDVTFWFGMEGDPVISMNSYTNDQEGYEDIELLESCVLYQLSHVDLRKLYEEDIYVANWGRKLAEQELVKTEQRYIARQFRTATERYIDLINNQRQLVQRVQLGYIASYLGISQVSLSRIRAEIK